MTLTQITKVKGPGIHTLANIVSNTISLGGIATASNFKTGTSNLHNVGLEIAGINVLGADTPIGTGATIYNSGAAVFTGVVTATSFSGSIAGTADLASGLTGTPDIAVRNITGVGATFTGNVSIGGTLTYEDVTNIDSIGIITARDGLKVLGGGANIVGVTTSTGGFVGALTGTASGNPTLTNGSNNRVVTATGANALTGESSLTYDALELHLNNASPKLKLTDTDNSGIVHLKNVGGVGVLTTTDAMIFETGNAASPERLRITSAGRVGINENSPDTDLHIKNTNPAIILEGTNGSGRQHKIWSAGTNSEALQFTSGNVYYNADAHYFRKSNESTEHLRILSDGKIGIGTENPSVRLHVSNGSIRSSNTAGTNFTELGSDGNIELKRTGGSAYIDFADATGNDADCRIQHVSDGFQFSTGGQGSRTTKLVINSAGKVLIGDGATYSPNGLLHVVGDDNSNGPELYLQVNNNNTTDNIGALWFGNNVDKTLVKLAGHTHTANNTADFTVSTSIGGTLGERLRITSEGQVKVTGANSGNHMTSFGSNVGGLTIDDVGASHTGLEVSHGSNKVFLVASSNNSVYFSSYGTGSLIFEHTGGGGGRERLVIDGSGHLKISNNTAKIRMGSSNQLELYHNGTYGYLNDTTSSGTELRIAGRVVRVMDNDSSHTAAYFSDDSAKLYSGNSEKLATTSTGITVGGEVAASQDYPDIRPALDFNFAAVKKLDPRIVYFRTGPASYTDEFGKVVLVGDSEPRFDHSFPEFWDEGTLGDSDSKGVSKGLLIEDARTNIFKNNHDLRTIVDHANLSWTTNTTETTAPDGSYSATKITGGDAGSWARFDSNNGLDISTINFTDTFTVSVYMKTVGTSNVNCNLDFGDRGSKTFSVGQEWKRYAISDTHHDYGANTKFVDLDPKGDIYIWGLQCEKGTFPTSYIPTRGTTVTRGGDYVGIKDIGGPDHADFWNTEEGTYLIDYEPLEIAVGDGVIIGSRRGSNGSGYPWPLYRHNTANTNNFKSYDLTSSIVSMSTTWAYRRETWALGFNGTNGSIVRNGTQLQTNNTNMKGLVDANELWLGSSGLGSLYSMHIKRFMYYPKRLPDSQLKTITS